MAKCNLGEVKHETDYAVSIANHVWAGLRAFSESKCFYRMIYSKMWLNVI